MWLDTLSIETYLIRPERLGKPLKYYDIAAGPEGWCFPISDSAQVYEVLRHYNFRPNYLQGIPIFKGEYQTYLGFEYFDDIEYFWGYLMERMKNEEFKNSEFIVSMA